MKQLIYRTLQTCGLFFFCLPILAFAADLEVIYPDREGIEEKNTYPYSVLELALNKSKTPYKLISRPLAMTDARVRVELASRRLSVAWFGTSKKFEEEFLPVRFPITKGLLGHRLFVVHKENQNVFTKVKSIKGLLKLTAGQGIGWADIEILRNAKLTVKTETLSSLFQMLDRKIGISYLPLGANEIYNFVEKRKQNMPNLTVERELAMIYPFDFFFFVNKTDTKLHGTIYEGLLRAYQDGSFTQLFESHPDHLKFFKKAKLKSRRKIYIDNPFMTKETSKALKTFSYTAE